MKKSIESASLMLSQVAPYLPGEWKSRLEKRIQSWAAAVATHTETVQTNQKKELPPLVMRAKGLPRSLDPLYFTLSK